MVIRAFSVRDLLSGRNLPPAEEMNRILTHTPAGCTAYTPVGPFLVRKATEAMEDIATANTTPRTDQLSTLNSQLSTLNSPCEICSLQAYHRTRHTCPLFASCAAHLRAADKVSVIFCRETCQEEEGRQSEVWQGQQQKEQREEDLLNEKNTGEKKHRRLRISERKKLYLRKQFPRRRRRH